MDKPFTRQELLNLVKIPEPSIHTIPTSIKDRSILIRDPKWSEMRKLKSMLMRITLKEDQIERNLSLIDFYIDVIKILAVYWDKEEERHLPMLLDDEMVGRLYYSNSSSDLLKLLGKVDKVLSGIIQIEDNLLSGSEDDDEVPAPPL